MYVTAYMWIIFAISASLFWGLSYVLNEEIYKKISIFSSIGIMSFVVFILCISIAYFTGSLKTDLITISSSKRLIYYLTAGVFALMIAEVFIGFSIVAKNATIAGLIEISYPIFIALFSYILFKNTITPPTMFGAVVIFFGVFIIYYFNK